MTLQNIIGGFLKMGLRKGSRIGSFRILAKIGSGGFSELFLASTTSGVEVALKVENSSQRQKVLRREASVFQALMGCTYIPRPFSFELAGPFCLLAMECLGPSISAVQAELRHGKFSLSTSLRIGIEIIRGLREMHARGFVHRDVKPSNIVLRPSFFRPIALIDFGLARKFINSETHQPLPPRVHPGFIGTSQFASYNALKGRDLGPRDDILSSVYTILQMRIGQLPWRDFGNHGKDLWDRLNVKMDRVFCQVPKQIAQIYGIARRLQVFENPNYDLLIALLNQAMTETECSWETPYEWMAFSKRKMKKLSPIAFVIPEGETPNMPTNLTEIEIPESEPIDEEADYEEGDTEVLEPVCAACEAW
jgi:serine/threonine protein kinase